MSPQPVLQPRHRPGTGMAIGLELLHPAGAQVDQGKFPGSKEGQQGKQCCQGQGATPRGARAPERHHHRKGAQQEEQEQNKRRKSGGASGSSGGLPSERAA